MRAISYALPSEPRVPPASDLHRETPSDRLFASIPIRQIMVPLSGAPLSERALPYARAMAETSGAGISLVYVESLEHPAEGTGVVSKPLDYLAGIRSQLDLRVPRVSTRVMRAASVVRGCVNAECTDSADLVVLAAHFTTDDSQRAISRFASEMISRSQAPVLLIPPDAPPPGESVRVLVLLDDSGQAEYALFPIIALSNTSRGQYIREITLLTVCGKQDEMTAAAAYLEEVCASVERLVAPRVHTNTEVAHGRVVATILEHVNEQTMPRFDLLAMTTHGQRSPHRPLLGPVASHVLSQVHLPTLVVNPRLH